MTWVVRRLTWLPAMALMGGLLQACASPPRGPAVPAERQDDALVPGMTAAVRTWGAAFNPAFNAAMLQSVEREQAALSAAGHRGPLPAADFMAISGGGANGAFGAGLLCGWTAAGTRPSFKLVTGISTGALTAPFAFLGPEYDATLREVYTQCTTKDILKERGFMAALFDDAMADTEPLWKLVERHVDQKLLDAIAAEYRKGRLLIIGTTNIDAQRAVLWNVGEIACSGAPGALDLVRRILIASAAIPGAFPPVLIEVEVDGTRYQEMHVDGGAMTQVFLYPPGLRLREAAETAGITRERRAFIIRNSRLDPEWAQVQRRTLSIVGRAISALIEMQGVGDLYRIYLNAQRDGIDYNVTCIPTTFTLAPKEAFDPEYMTELFQVGFELARGGYPWQKTPPLYESEPQ